MSDLDFARGLIDAGMPVFVAPANGEGFSFPGSWQTSQCTPRVLDAWKPGDALCAVTGVSLDVLDVDPRHGGDLTLARWRRDGLLPKVYAEVGTPGGGVHLYVARLRIPKTSEGGIDVQAGDDTGRGRGFVFIPPTVRGHGGYRVATLGLEAFGQDEASGSALLASLHNRPKEAAGDPYGTPDNELGVPVPHGQHDRAGARFAARLAAQGVIWPYARVLLEARCRDFVGADPAHPFTPRDLERWWKGAHDKFAPAALQEGALDIPATWQVQDRWWEGPGEDPPSALLRADGKGLLYAGKVNSIIGPSESGKSWLALLAVMQHPGQVTFVDFESDGPSIAGRLRQMGLPQERLEQIRYLRPDEAYTGRGVGPADLVVVDGLNTFYSLHGVDYIDTVEVTRFHKRVLEPWADLGVCVVVIDHTTKNRGPGQGSGAIGSQAKRATVTGASLLVRMTESFGRKRLGKATVFVDKDRPGYVRGLQCEDDSVAQLIVDDRYASTTVELDASPWVAKEFVVQDQAVARHAAIQRALADGPLSLRRLAELVGRDRNRLDSDLEELESRGLLRRTPGPRRSMLHEWVGESE